MYHNATKYLVPLPQKWDTAWPQSLSHQSWYFKEITLPVPALDTA